MDANYFIQLMLVLHNHIHGSWILATHTNHPAEVKCTDEHNG